MPTRWSNFGWGDIDRSFAALDELRRRMDRVFEEVDYERGWPSLLGLEGRRVTWPAANLYDVGDEYVVEAVVPGVSESDFDINLTQNVLTVSGERKVEDPQGYSVHRRERGGVKFSRSFTFPTRIDPEKASASLKNGILRVSVAKAAESRPRQITVQAS